MSLTSPAETPPQPEPDPAGQVVAADPAGQVVAAEPAGQVAADPARQVVAADPARQLSLFGVEAANLSPADLAGLLAGPGEVVRMGGTARVSVPVDDAWRVHVLVAELALRGLAASWVPTAQRQYRVQSSYTSALAPLAAAWLRDAGPGPPAGFHLTGPRLRLWAAAAGAAEPPGFLLRLGGSERHWATVGDALAAMGLPAELLTTGWAGWPAYRISGRRRLARLAELVGDRPAAAPVERWPGS